MNNNINSDDDDDDDGMTTTVAAVVAAAATTTETKAIRPTSECMHIIPTHAFIHTYRHTRTHNLKR